MLVANQLAKGALIFTEKHDFLPVYISINNYITLIELTKKLDMLISRELDESEPAKAFMKKTWNLVQRLEVQGLKLRQDEQKLTPSEMIDHICFCIADTVRAITELSGPIVDLGLKDPKDFKDGIVILLDEVDNASKELNLGIFLKTLSEILVREESNRVLIVLAGLPTVRNILQESHESSLRLFTEHVLGSLSQEEVEHVIKSCIEETNKYSDEIPIKIDSDALKIIFEQSKGFPPLVQQIGFLTFSVNTDDLITVKDVEEGISRIDDVG
jgi:hypothetical protein